MRDAPAYLRAPPDATRARVARIVTSACLPQSCSRLRAAPAAPSISSCPCLPVHGCTRCRSPCHGCTAARSSSSHSEALIRLVPNRAVACRMRPSRGTRTRELRALASSSGCIGLAWLHEVSRARRRPAQRDRIDDRVGRRASIGTQPPATSAPGPGSPLPHLRRDWARPFPHPHREWAHPRHICTGTGPTPAASAPGPGSPLPHLCPDCAHRTADTSAPGLGPPRTQKWGRERVEERRRMDSRSRERTARVRLAQD